MSLARKTEMGEWQRNGLSQNPWLEHFFRPLLIGVMAVCLVMPLVELSRYFAPGWNSVYLLLACLLVPLEAHHSYRLMRSDWLLDAERFRFRTVELAAFFIVLKVTGYLGRSWPEVWADVQSWPTQPENLFDLGTLFAFGVVLIVWWGATATTDNLRELSRPIERHAVNQPSSLPDLMNRFYWGGIVLLILAGVARIGISELLNLERPSLPGLVLNVLVYFVLGLVMLGQARLIDLSRDWRSEGMPVAEQIPGRWVRYSLILIGLAAFLAFLLPTRYTLSLLDLVALVLSVVNFLLILIYFVLTLPLAWLLSLFSGKAESPPTPAPTPTLSPLPPSAGTDIGWLEVIRSLLFWGITLGLLIYVVRSYLGERSAWLRALAALGAARWLRRWWQALRRWWQGWTGGVDRHLRQWSHQLRGRLAGRGGAVAPFRFFRLGALSPRERLLYYYLSIVRRAGEQGIPRRRSETPYEYNATLESCLPDARLEMAQLTAAFVEARYSRHEVAPDEARRVQTCWQRVKRALQLLRRGETALR